MPIFSSGSGRRAALPLLCAVHVLAPSLRAQETLSSVQRELDRVERETEREKDLHKAERARAAEFEKQKAERLNALRQQMQLSDARIDSLKQRMETERRRRASQRALTAQFQARQKAFRAEVDAYAQRLWGHVEAAAGAPWFLGARRSALDIYLAVMTKWRPRRDWFAAHAPKLLAAADAAAALPAVAPVMARNFPA